MRRNRAYFLLMGAALALVVLAWTVVRIYSIPAVVANAGDEYSRGWLGRSGSRRRDS